MCSCFTNAGKAGVYLVLCISFLAGVAALTADAVEVVEAHMEIVTDEIVGVALYPDGITPIRDLPVRVWSVDGQKMIYRTRTDEDGVFQIPWLNEGRCYVFIGRVKVDLRVLTADVNTVHQHHDIVAVVPRGMLVSSRPHLMDVVMAGLLLPPPDEPRVVSP